MAFCFRKLTLACWSLTSTVKFLVRTRTDNCGHQRALSSFGLGAIPQIRIFSGNGRQPAGH